MIPADFDYVAPLTLDEATHALAESPGAKVLAGGMSLIPAMKHRLLQPARLVDIARIAELSGVNEKRGRVRIGACTPHADLLGHPQLADYPIFGETASLIGDVQVRNRGTVGGSLVHADPAADWPAVFLALDGEAKLVNASGERSVRAEDFFVGMLTTAATENDILIGIELHLERKRAGGAYAKLRQRASGFAVVGVAAQVVTDRKGRIDKVALGVTGVNAVPFRAHSLEARLRTAHPGADLRKLCSDADEADPMEDLHASAEYRSHLLGVFAARAVQRAWLRART